MSIGKRIQETRISRGLTQEDVAKIVGVATQTIYKYEKEIVTNIPLNRLYKIAEALQTTVAYLQGYINDSSIQTVDLNKIVERANELKEEANWKKQINSGIGFLNVPNDKLRMELDDADQELIDTIHSICGMRDLKINEAILSDKLREIYNPRKIKIVQEFIQDNEKTLKKMIETME